jgi:hypothetical protein
MREKRSTLGCFITTTTTTPLKIPPHSHSRYSFMSSQLQSCIPHIDVDQTSPPLLSLSPACTYLSLPHLVTQRLRDKFTATSTTLLVFWCKDVQNVQQFLDGCQLMSRLESFITSGPVPPSDSGRTLIIYSNFAIRQRNTPRHTSPVGVPTILHRHIPPLSVVITCLWRHR